MSAMESLWLGSEKELSTLRLCKAVGERPDYRLSRRKLSKSLIPAALLHSLPDMQPRVHRRRRSGTWP